MYVDDTNNNGRKMPVFVEVLLLCFVVFCKAGMCIYICVWCVCVLCIYICVGMCVRICVKRYKDKFQLITCNHSFNN